MGLLLHWDPDCPLALASKMVNDKETFGGWSFAEFSRGARFLTDADVESPNPAIEASIALMLQCERLVGQPTTLDHWGG